MKMLKKIKTDMWINVFLMLAIGILFIIRPQDSLKLTAIIAGAIIFADGLFDLAYYLKVWSDFYSRGSLFEGILKFVLGIFIFTHADTTSVLFSYVFSIYIVINGIICLETSIYMQKVLEANCAGYMLLSCFAIFIGIAMMFFTPGDAVKALAIVTGIVFIVSAIIDAAILIRVHVVGKKCAEKLKYVSDELNGNIIDADDVRS